MATVRSTTLDSQPVPISRRRVWDRGNSGTHGRVVAWSSMSSASGREKWRNVWRRIGVHRSDGVGSDSPGSPWETSNNTLLAHDSLYSGTLSWPGTPSSNELTPASFHPYSVHSPRLYDGQSMVVDISIPTSLAFACRWQLLRQSRDIAVHVID